MNRNVVDCSMTCSWLFGDENDSSSAAVLLNVGNFGAYVPLILWAETRNVLITSERRGRITPAETDASLFLLSGLDIRVDDKPVESAVLEFARRHNLSVYGALYLELADRRNASLATFDRALIRAAEMERIPLAN